MYDKELQCVYILLLDEVAKAKHKIDAIDRTIEYCDRLNAEYWCDKRVEAVAYLDGLHKALDIVFKELNR